MRRFLPFLLLLCSPAYAQSPTGLIANGRFSSGTGGISDNGWAQAGVVGGIPTNYTQCGSTIAAYTGNTDTINNALTACAANHFVLLGAGTFNLTTGGAVSPGIRIRKNGVVLRGSGANSTFLVFGAGAKDGCGGFSAPICLQSNTATGNYPNDGTTTSWSAGFSQGATSVTVASTTGITANQSVIWLSQCSATNSGASCTSNPEVDNSNFFDCDVLYNGTNGCAVNGPDGGNQQLNRPQAELFLVSAVNTGTGVVTLAGSLRNPNWASAETPTATIINPVMNSGIENLSIDATSVTTSSGVIDFYWTYNCWIHGVRYVNIPYAGTWSILGVHDTFEQNYTYGSTLTPGADNYAWNITSGSDNLIQNNIIQKEEGTLLMEGSDTGSVIAYNFSIFENNGNNTGINPAYFPHAGDRYELWEGNIANAWFGENFHGPKIAATLYRNFFTGWESGVNQTPSVIKGGGSGNGTTPIRYMHHSRYGNSIGNVLGTPGYSTTYSTTSLAFCSGCIYELGTPDVAPTDPIVGTTRYNWANWDVVTNAVRRCSSAEAGFASPPCSSVSEIPTGAPVLPQANPTVGTSASPTMPASLYLASQPSWFRSLPFPLIGPDVSSGTLGVCAGTLNTAGHFSGVPATSSANCVNNTLTVAFAGHANANPAMDCFLNVMGGLPDGTNASALTFNANTCFGGSSTVALPSCTPTSGVPTISITCTNATPSAVMCYRLDGVNPAATTPGTCDAGSTTYSAPISVTVNPTTLKILGTLVGDINSAVLSQLYTSASTGTVINGKAQITGKVTIQ